MNAFELSILDFIQNHLRCRFLDFLMPLITKLGDKGIAGIILVVILLMFKKTRKIGLTAGISIILGFIFGNIILKNVVARIRPYDLNREITLLIYKLKEYSFPSGHTLVAFECATSVALYNKKWGTFVIVLAVLVALSRLYLYVHYPTDVLAGAALGVIIALVAKQIVEKAIYKSQ